MITHSSPTVVSSVPPQPTPTANVATLELIHALGKTPSGERASERGRGLFVHWTIFRFIGAQVTASDRAGWYWWPWVLSLSFPLPETPAHISARKGDKELEREVH